MDIIKWTRTRINKLTEVRNDDCIIVIPIYKKALKADEKISLFQCIRTLGNDFEICLVYPKGLDVTYYSEISGGFKFSLLECNPDYFKTTTSYSCLCETADFYYAFLGYRYMLIYQLDGWVFRNDLYQFINMNYDYIGSPWPAGSYGFGGTTVGNGGVSLRNIDKFIELCNSLNIYDYESKYAPSEDIFFCKYVRSIKKRIPFSIASAKDATKFSWTTQPSMFYGENNNHLPVFAHGWNNVFDYEFWQDYIPLNDFESIKDLNYNIYINKIKKIEQSNNKKLEESIQQFTNMNEYEDYYETGNVNADADAYGYGFNQVAQTSNTTAYDGYEIVSQPDGVTVSYDFDVTPPVEEVEDDVIEYEDIEIEIEPHSNVNICDKTQLKEFDKENPIIVTFTTWKKRINNIPFIIDCILANTMQPDRICINLAIEDFPNFDNDFPDALVSKLNKHKDIIEINWMTNNTKVWKKLIPTLCKYPEAIVISIDDDWKYPNDIIETLYNDYCSYGKKYPISGNKTRLFDMNCHCGSGSLTTYRLLNSNGQFDTLSDECMQAGSDDIFYSYCAKVNGNEYKQSSKMYFLNMESYQSNDGYGQSSNVNIEKTYNIAKENYEKQQNNNRVDYICKEILKSSENGYICYICEGENGKMPTPCYDYNDQIIVTLTSWKKRINNVLTTLKCVMKNTMLPAKVVVNLAIEEFANKENDLPKELVNYINDNKIIEINWVKNNTKVWKKSLPTLFKYPNALVLCIDDDIIYTEDLIQTFNDMYKKDSSKAYVGVTWQIARGYNQHCGCSTLDSLKFLKQYVNMIDKEIMDTGDEDTFMTYCYKRAGVKLEFVGKKFGTNLPAISTNDSYTAMNKPDLKGNWQKLARKYDNVNLDHLNVMPRNNEMFNNDILICIFNYKHDKNAKKWLHMLQPYFETYVLDSGNDHEDKEFIQYPNIYYSGLFNEMKKLSEKKNYKWVGQICSDIEIDTENVKKLINAIFNLNNLDTVGIWQPGTTKQSRKSWSYNKLMDLDNELLKVSIIEGWMHFIRKTIIDNIPYVDTNINTYGYGLDIYESYISNVLNYLNVIDTNIKVYNPIGTGYDNKQACMQGNAYLNMMLGNTLQYYIKKYEVKLLKNVITFVVPFRNRDNMKQPFEANVHKYFSDNGYEIIYVIQDDQKPFMISQLRNIGFAHAKTDFVVFRDIDVMDLDKVNLVEIYNKLQNPYRTYNKRQHINIQTDGTYQYKDNEHVVTGFGGYTVFKKEDWKKHNGFTNLCIGWGYEDDMTKIRYDLKTYDRVFGHIWHKSNDSFSSEDTKINKEAYNLEKTGKIDYTLDGYKQLKYNITSNKILSYNIREIKVCNIGVISDYSYKELLSRHKDAMVSGSNNKISIAIVGNSPILSQSNLGNEIDSHDIVIRFNNYNIEGRENSYGKKVTKLVVANSCKPYTHKDLFMSLNKNNRIFISCNNVADELYGVFENSLIVNDVTLIDKDAYFIKIRDKMNNYKDNHFASSRLLIMQYIVDNYPNATIDAYGFTFFSEEKDGKKIHDYDNCDASWHDGDKEQWYFNKYLKNKINLRNS